MTRCRPCADWREASGFRETADGSTKPGGLHSAAATEKAGVLPRFYPAIAETRGSSRTASKSLSFFAASETASGSSS
jgi:hypothetical protein